MKDEKHSSHKGGAGRCVRRYPAVGWFAESGARVKLR
jgi:hypothetical protein